MLRKWEIFIKDDTKITSRIKKSNESETCGLGLELDLNLRPVDLDLRSMNLDLTISESEDLEEEDLDLDLPLWNLTTYLVSVLVFSGSVSENTTRSTNTPSRWLGCQCFRWWRIWHELWPRSQLTISVVTTKNCISASFGITIPFQFSCTFLLALSQFRNPMILQTVTIVM